MDNHNLNGSLHFVPRRPFPLRNFNRNRHNVCRNLFGSDPEQTRVCLQKQSNQIDQELNEKYNFDFKGDKPINGNGYIWEKVRYGDQADTVIVNEVNHVDSNSDISNSNNDEGQSTRTGNHELNDLTFSDENPVSIPRTPTDNKPETSSNQLPAFKVNNQSSNGSSTPNIDEMLKCKKIPSSRRSHKLDKE